MESGADSSFGEMSVDSDGVTSRELEVEGRVIGRKEDSD